MYKHVPDPSCLLNSTGRVCSCNLDPRTQIWRRKREGGREKLNMRGDNVMGSWVGGGGWPIHRDRERASAERTEGRDEHRRGGVLVRAGACSGPLQAVAQNRALVWFFFSPLFFLPFSSTAVREKPVASRGNLTAGQKSSEGQRELYTDGTRRVFKKAALVSEGGMAVEYGLPFQEGRTWWRSAWIDDWINKQRFLGLYFSCPLIHCLFFPFVVE